MLKGVLIATALGFAALPVASGPAAAVPTTSKIEAPRGVTEVGRRHHRWHGHRHHRRGWHNRHSGFRVYVGPATTTVAEAARGSGIGPLSRAAPTGGGVTAGAEAGKTPEHRVLAAGLH